MNSQEIETLTDKNKSNENKNPPRKAHLKILYGTTH